MTTFFLMVCSVSVIFFLVFFWQCGKPMRSAKTLGNAFRPTELISADLTAGRRTLAHLETQMAEFLGNHQRSASLLLVGLVLVSTAANVKA